MQADQQQKQADDKILLAHAANGDQLAIENLLNRYKDLVRRKASSMYIAGADNEDVIQEGMIGLFKAIRNYRPVHEVPFSAFASYCIMAQITDAVRQASRKKHKPLNDSLSLQGMIQDDGDGMRLLDIFVGSADLDPEESLVLRENLIDLQYFMQQELSSLERQVVLLLIQQLSYQQIADCLDCTTKKVDNALHRARVKFSHYRKNQGEIKSN